MDDTLDSCEAVVIPRDNPEAGYFSRGQEIVSTVKSPPQVEVDAELDEIELDVLESDPVTVEMIQERVKAKLDAKRALAYSNGLFMKVYDSLAKTTNITSNSVHVLMKLFSVNDANQCRWNTSDSSWGF